MKAIQSIKTSYIEYPWRIGGSSATEEASENIPTTTTSNPSSSPSTSSPSSSSYPPGCALDRLYKGEEDKSEEQGEKVTPSHIKSRPMLWLAKNVCSLQWNQFAYSPSACLSLGPVFLFWPCLLIPLIKCLQPRLHISLHVSRIAPQGCSLKKVHR